MQNAYIERKNGSIRELLNAYLFNSLVEVRVMSEEWRMDYNMERPNKSLGYLSPLKYADHNYGKVALLILASETLKKIEAMPIVNKAVDQKKIIFENPNSQVVLKKGAYNTSSLKK